MENRKKIKKKKHTKEKVKQPLFDKKKGIIYRMEIID